MTFITPVYCALCFFKAYFEIPNIHFKVDYNTADIKGSIKGL